MEHAFGYLIIAGFVIFKVVGFILIAGWFFGIWGLSD